MVDSLRTSGDFSVSRTAVFSEDRAYRYVLRRAFVGEEKKPQRLCVWLNPSMADEFTDDASIRVGMGYARRWGDGGIVVVNLYSLIETKSEKLRARGLPLQGPSHFPWIEGVVAGEFGRLQKEVLCGWGDTGEGKDAEAMLALLRNAGLVPAALTLTKRGNPSHPLRKKRDLVLEPFPGKEHP